VQTCHFAGMENINESSATGNQSAAKRRPRQPAPRVRTARGSIRKFNELVLMLTADFGRNPTPYQAGLIRQAAALLLRCEQQQAAVVRGVVVSADELVRLSSEARRIMSGLSKQVDRPAMQDAASRSSPLLDRLRASPSSHASSHAVVCDADAED
jgi:hypothetical protein